MRGIMLLAAVFGTLTALAAAPPPKVSAPKVPAPVKPAAPPTAAPVDQRTKAQTQAAKEFSFEGTVLGMPLATFLEKYPGASPEPAESNEKVGLVSYRVKTLETADEAQFLFLDGYLFQMAAFYSPERLKEMGGQTIPLRKLVQKLGKQDKNSPGIVRNKGEETFTAKWDFADLRLRIRFVASAKHSSISITETAKAAQIGKRVTDNAELGF